ncbi:MAG: nucleotidyltransferase family protein [bacterium]
MTKLEMFKEAMRRELPELKKQYKIKMIGFFGSYARGEERKDSDLDVLVEFSTSPDIFRFIKLENQLSDLLHVKVDLVTKGALKPIIKDRILGETSFL